MWSVHTGVELEKRGVPTAVICSTAFAHLGRSTAASMGLEGLPIAPAPHPFDSLPRPAVERAAEEVADEIVHILNAPAQELEREYAKTWTEPPQDVVAACSLSSRPVRTAS